ncbi:FAD-binding domain-containing protein [uncultured Roseobacter sp.]|uniref:FAD-binding domain-containing protein n=1 Tax=uncultured Roseobacter sp. TaxID=114847 RepID=UPI0026381618|nr:FAD-binding domain-containing protein [uncultured Roseobacter sp.]
MTVSDLFIPDRTAALERLQQFLPHAGRDYAARRNYDTGPGAPAGVSMLSPWLRCRLITEEEVVRAVLGRHSHAAAEKFVQEVFWRTYWKGWLELRPGVWNQYQAAVGAHWDAVQTQAGLRARWEAACRGETGISCFDFWARELAETGWLHNHARMWFASIWIFTLELPWELGADFFLRHLLDGDPASNTLGWRWVAGIQTPGKTYLARTSNISKYTEGRFHPKWQLAGVARAIEAPAPPAAGLLPAPAAPRPGLRTGFVLHEDDLSPGFMLDGPDSIRPQAAALLIPQTRLGPLQSAPHVAAFRRAALRDAAARWQDRMGGPPAEAESTEALLDWAARENLEQIIAPYAPVGPVAGTLAGISAQKDAPALVQIMRPTDRAAWPLATRGFFPFSKHIPALIEQMI